MNKRVYHTHQQIITIRVHLHGWQHWPTMQIMLANANRMFNCVSLNTSLDREISKLNENLIVQLV